MSMWSLFALWGVALIMGLLPVVLVVLWAVWSRKRDKRRSPFTTELQHLPGQSAAVKAERLADKADEQMLVSVLIGPIVLAGWALSRVNPQAFHFGWAEALLVAIVVVVSFVFARSSARLLKERRHYLEGRAGERATAQALMPLMAKGCMVYNDIPAGEFNLDHVVIGLDRVYVIETKSRRKPAKHGKDSAQVRFDGHVLQFPGWQETRPLDQARAEARWLAQHVYRKLGERISVDPVLAFPGWYVTQSAPSTDVHVINPAVHRFMADCKGTPLGEPLRRRIMTVLEECYRAPA